MKGTLWLQSTGCSSECAVNMQSTRPHPGNDNRSALLQEKTSWAPPQVHTSLSEANAAQLCKRDWHLNSLWVAVYSIGSHPTAPWAKSLIKCHGWKLGKLIRTRIQKCRDSNSCSTKKHDKLSWSQIETGKAGQLFLCTCLFIQSIGSLFSPGWQCSF